MKRLGRTFILGAVLFSGCGTTRNVAVSSYHVTRDVAVGSYRVATAPVHYAFRRHSGGSDTAMTTETIPSDVNQPGEPVPPQEVASAAQQRPQPTRERTRSTSTSAQITRRENASSKPSSQRNASSSQSEFPTAKAVPGKPGYVFSPFDTDKRYVDVSGYASGSKVKDPWTDKIFVVP
jgi:hypothetical protein